MPEPRLMCLFYLLMEKIRHQLHMGISSMMNFLRLARLGKNLGHKMNEREGGWERRSELLVRKQIMILLIV